MSATLHESIYLRAALLYAEALDLCVFPLAFKTKFPLKGSHGHLDATKDPARVRELFSQRSLLLNIGLAAAASGLVVLDVDVRAGGDETLGALERIHGPLPHTPRGLSGAGDGSQHFFFKDPGGVCFPAQLGPGIEIKHQGFVVVPPSVHPKSGRRYVWQVRRLDLVHGPQGRGHPVEECAEDPRRGLVERGPRMADFAIWTAAAEPRLGIAPGSIAAAYERNRILVVAAALDASPVAIALRGLLRKRPEWEGTPAQLLEKLTTYVPIEMQSSKSWPKAPHHLSGRLRRAAGALRQIGIEVEESHHGRDADKERWIKIRAIGDDEKRTSKQKRSKK